MDFDSRDYDTGDDERLDPRDTASHDLNLDDDLRWPDERDRDRDDDPRESTQTGPDARDEARWLEREHSPDPREAFTRELDLPRGREREIVRDRDREYTLRGSETRTLATVGAFRVVSSRDLRDDRDRPLDPRSSDLRHLREQGLVETVRVPGSREYAVALDERRPERARTSS